MCRDIKQMKASSGGLYSSPQEGRKEGGPDSRMSYHAALSCSVYAPSELVSQRDLTRRRFIKRIRMWLSSFLLLIQLVNRFPHEQRSPIAPFLAYFLIKPTYFPSCPLITSSCAQSKSKRVPNSPNPSQLSRSCLAISKLLTCGPQHLSLSLIKDSMKVLVQFL